MSLVALMHDNMFNHSHSCNVIKCINDEPICSSISMPPFHLACGLDSLQFHIYVSGW